MSELVTNTIKDLQGLNFTSRILNIQEYLISTAYSTTQQVSAGLVVLEPPIEYTPLRSDSNILLIATLRGNVTQSGGDDDATGALTLAYKNGNTYSAITTSAISLGVVNSGTNPQATSMVPVIDYGTAAGLSDTDGVIRLAAYGAVGTDATAGYISTLSLATRKYIIVELL